MHIAIKHPHLTDLPKTIGIRTTFWVIKLILIIIRIRDLIDFSMVLLMLRKVLVRILCKIKLENTCKNYGPP